MSGLVLARGPHFAHPWSNLIGQVCGKQMYFSWHRKKSVFFLDIIKVTDFIFGLLLAQSLRTSNNIFCFLDTVNSFILPKLDKNNKSLKDSLATGAKKCIPVAETSKHIGNYTIPLRTH